MNQFLQSPNLLQTIISESEASNAAASELAADLNEEQLNWKPGPEKWSIAQCLDHLAVTSSKFDQYLETALGRGRSKWPVTSPPAYRPTRMALHALQPGGRFRHYGGAHAATSWPGAKSPRDPGLSELTLHVQRLRKKRSALL